MSLAITGKRAAAEVIDLDSPPPAVRRCPTSDPAPTAVIDLSSSGDEAEPAPPALSTTSFSTARLPVKSRKPRPSKPGKPVTPASIDLLSSDDDALPAHSSALHHLADNSPRPTSTSVSLPPDTRVVTKAVVSKLVTLAKPYTPSTDVTGWYISEKLDGMRAVWVGGNLYSRAGNRVYAPPWFLGRLPVGIVLDGELFLGRGRFQDVMSVCRSQRACGRWAEVRYVVFDAPEADGGIGERLQVARDAVGGGSASVEVIRQDVCGGVEELVLELKRVEALGGEGLMLRHPQHGYKSGRIADLLKVKSFKDDEALVLGHEDGKGKHAGRMGALRCKSRSGSSFKVGSGFTDTEREEPPAVGTVITYRFFELTTDGIPRFPVYDRVRPDVKASCFS